MKAAPTTPEVADSHWATPPERDARTYLKPALRGELGDGHTREAPCLGCLHLVESLRRALASRDAAVEAPQPVAAPTPAPRAAGLSRRLDPDAVRLRDLARAGRLTTREVILVAAWSLADENNGPCDTWSLVVRAWELCPDRFALPGRPQHPNSNAVIAKLSGGDSVVALGWLRRAATSTYVVTAAGRKAAHALVEKHAAEGAVR